jgi:hypothetical protein
VPVEQRQELIKRIEEPRESQESHVICYLTPLQAPAAYARGFEARCIVTCVTRGCRLTNARHRRGAARTAAPPREPGT